MSINSISATKIKEIEAASVKTLPDTVTGQASRVKDAIYDPVDKVITEVNRVVSDANADIEKKYNKVNVKSNMPSTMDNMDEAVLNIPGLKALMDSVVAKIKLDTHPIGYIWISVEDKNPSEIVGGTWQKITSDAYLKIVTSGAGNEGGTSSAHKIPTSSIPAHAHNVTSTLNNAGGGISLYSGPNGGMHYGIKTDPVGGGQAYYPYYYGVYVFRRTA